jgi:hypothetical protein
VRCQNTHLVRFENFWSSEATSVVYLVEPDDILNKMVYAYTNPSAANLVDTVEEWPGVTTFEATLSGGSISASRPKHFFRDDSGMPDVVDLPIGLRDTTRGQTKKARPATPRSRPGHAQRGSVRQTC